MKAKKYPSKEYFLNIFEYVSGKLHYRKDYKNKKFAGKRAGREQKAGYKSYWQVKSEGKLYYEHRVVWIMFFGEIPSGMVIDHINAYGKDNRIENLRVVDVTTNNRNKARSSRGSASGYTGVTFDKSCRKYKAHIQVKGKHINLGLFSSPTEAYSARLRANVKYGFETSHGASMIEHSNV